MSTSHAGHAKAPVPLRLPGERPLSLPNLPTPLTSFIGREREVATVADLIRRSDVRLVTLTGPGGAGKTRLAIEVGRAVGGDFDDVVFVSLAAIREPHLVLPMIAQALGLREAGHLPLLDRLAVQFESRTALFILDNFEQVLDAATLIVDLLSRCPGLTVLITSREVLRLSGERDVPVPPLATPAPADTHALDDLAQAPAVALFVERAQAALPSFILTPGNAPAVAAVCARLDGLPLAIELAAAHARVLSPAAMLARLDHRLALLTGGPRDQPLRLRTMHAAIAWSYDLLDADDRATFRRLAVFEDGFTLDAAEQVISGSGVPQPAVRAECIHARTALARVETLVDKSLVQQAPGGDGEPRFRMLETIREFGLAQLDAHDEAPAIRAAHAAYYLALAETAETKLIVAGSATWVERLAAERANLRAAVAWTRAQGQAEPVLRLCGTLLSFAYARGEPAEGLAWLEAALAIAEPGPSILLADARFVASALAQVQGDFARAIALCEQGLATARACGYAFGQARALLGLGITAEWQGDLERAGELYEQALALLREVDESVRLAHWLVLPLANLGDVALLRGDPSRAARLAGEAVERWRAVGYLWGIAQALGTVAAAASEQGDQSEAARLYEETLDLWLACADGRGIAGTIAGIAALAAACDGPERAARLLGAAWTLGERLGIRFLGHHLYAERVLAAVRARLDPAAYAAAWEAGGTLATDQAVAEARAVLRLASSAPSPAHDLTPRELDVLRLIVTGRSNREIAEILYISPRTVQTHVANLFTKLGAGTRAEVSAIAIRSGIV